MPSWPRISAILESISSSFAPPWGQHGAAPQARPFRDRPAASAGGVHGKCAPLPQAAGGAHSLSCLLDERPLAVGDLDQHDRLRVVAAVILGVQGVGAIDADQALGAFERIADTVAELRGARLGGLDRLLHGVLE